MSKDPHFRHNRCGGSFPAIHVNQSTFRCPNCGQTLDPKIIAEIKSALNGATQGVKEVGLKPSFLGVICDHCFAPNQKGNVCTSCGKNPHGQKTLEEDSDLEELEVLDL